MTAAHTWVTLTRGGIAVSLRPLATLAIAGSLLAAEPASAYAILEDFSWGGVTSTHEAAPRWSSVSGLSDGVIQVGVESGFEAEMGAVTPGQVEALRERVVAAFEVWENDALRFEVTFDTDATVDPYSGSEIDLLAVTREEVPFIAGFYGYTQTVFEWFGERPLTNGQVYPGFAIVSADIYLDREQFELQLSSYGPLGLDALQRLISHEIGHTIGLGHPNEDEPFLFHTNYDTDFDPENVMAIDPADPFADLLVSPHRNNLAVMSNRPCGPDAPISEVCAESFDTALSNDDLGARDVFYPVPEPARGALLAAGAGLVAALGRRRLSRERPSRTR